MAETGKLLKVTEQCQLGAFISSQIHLQPAFLASRGIILSVAMQQSGKTPSQMLL